MISKRIPVPAELPENSRRQRRAAETRIKIFRAAMQLFAEFGLAQVTVEQITVAADVGKGTFFNYFASKEHILAVLVEIQMAKLGEAIELASAGSNSAQLVMRRLVKRLAEEPGRSQEMARTILSSFFASSEIRTMVSGFLETARNEFARFIALGQKRGEIDPALPSKKVAHNLQRMMFGTFLLWSLQGKAPLENSVEECFEHFWRGIAARK